MLEVEERLEYCSAGGATGWEHETNASNRYPPLGLAFKGQFLGFGVWWLARRVDVFGCRLCGGVVWCRVQGLRFGGGGFWDLGFFWVEYVDKEASRSDSVALEKVDRLWWVDVLGEVEDRGEAELLEKEKVLASREPTTVDAAADAPEVEGRDQEILVDRGSVGGGDPRRREHAPPVW